MKGKKREEIRRTGSDIHSFRGKGSRTDHTGNRRTVIAVSAALFVAAAFFMLPEASERAYAQALVSSSVQTFRAAAGKESERKAAEAEAAGKGSDQKSEEAEKSVEYVKNRWNFVEISMDVSGGIPEDIRGRLALIREAGKLRVATEPHYAPQEFIDPSLEGQDQYQGADMELARLIAERMGVELEIVPLEFTEVLSETAAGTYDLAISGLAYTPARANSMELTKGYHYSQDDSRTGFLIRKADEIGRAHV